MYYIIVIKAAQHMYNGICSTYVGQKLVTQSFALTGAFYKASYINNFNNVWYYTFWLYYFSKLG